MLGPVHRFLTLIEVLAESGPRRYDSQGTLGGVTLQGLGGVILKGLGCDLRGPGGVTLREPGGVIQKGLGV